VAHYQIGERFDYLTGRDARSAGFRRKNLLGNGHQFRSYLELLERHGRFILETAQFRAAFTVTEGTSLRIRLWRVLALPIVFGLMAAEEPAWKTKSIPDWSADDARQVLTDSPWAKSVTPTLSRVASAPGSRPGRRGGVGFPGGRRGGYGYPGGAPRGGDPGSGANQPPTLRLRWESALPVREAELKARDTNAPTIGEDHYAIAVYGVPSRLVNADSKSFADELKKDAALKRDGKRELKPSSVEVLQRDSGPVILFQFPRPKDKEITSQDRRVEFDAKIGRLQFTQSFYTEDMLYQGKLEL